MASRLGTDQNLRDQRQRYAAAERAAGVRRERPAPANDTRPMTEEISVRASARVNDSPKGYMWSTPKSAAFFAATIVLALLLAKLLALVIDLRPE